MCCVSVYENITFRKELKCARLALSTNEVIHVERDTLTFRCPMNDNHQLISLTFLSTSPARAAQNHERKLQPQIMSHLRSLKRSTGKIPLVTVLIIVIHNSECHSFVKAVVLNLLPTQYTVVTDIPVRISSSTITMSELS